MVRCLIVALFVFFAGFNRLPMNTGASTWSKAFRLPRSSTRGTRSPRRYPRAFSRGTKLLLQPTKSTKLWTTSRPACPLPTHRPKSSMSGIKYHRFPIPLASVCACVCVCLSVCMCVRLSLNLSLILPSLCALDWCIDRRSARSQLQV